jgi:hypothetical protein
MIKKLLDEYLEFDSNLLFSRVPIEEYGNQLKRLVRIFGGAIRDIIAGQTINDIDILVGAQSCKLIEEVLSEQGYTYMYKLIPKDLSSVYKDIRVINEPRTWMKGNKMVQLIRPVILQNQHQLYERGFLDLIQNVDISSCGVSWDGETLYENYPNAIAHCQNLSFFINEDAKMYSSNRSFMRGQKFIERGWRQIKMDDLSISRDIKINNILNESRIEYKSELPNGVYTSNKNIPKPIMWNGYK